MGWIALLSSYVNIIIFFPQTDQRRERVVHFVYFCLHNHSFIDLFTLFFFFLPASIFFLFFFFFFSLLDMVMGRSLSLNVLVGIIFLKIANHLRGWIAVRTYLCASHPSQTHPPDSPTPDLVHLYLLPQCPPSESFSQLQTYFSGPFTGSIYLNLRPSPTSLPPFPDFFFGVPFQSQTGVGNKHRILPLI